MLSSGLPPVFLVLTVLELSWSLSDEEKKIILDEHNRYRSHVFPPARAMMKMTWDMELEADAQAYAENCTWKHEESDQHGKNLFALASTLDLRHAVAEWNEERKFYNLLTSKCDPGKTCDSYKQVVWAETEFIGCGAKLCEKIEGMEIEHMYLLVCNYSPQGKGNGWKPYWEGSPCSMCPEDTTCVDNLCDTEKWKTDQSTDGAASTCSGLLLFLLPSAILLGLLL